MAEKSKVSRRSNTKKLSLVFEHAHQAVQEAQQAFTETARMASTLVILEILDDYAIWGHVGDSRLYFIRQGEIRHQTKDHSVPQMLVGSGELKAEEIRGHPDRNRLLRALGDKRETIKARMVKTPEKLEHGDAFFIMFRWFLGMGKRG
jgi:serine/threonine protein phosphatase PrpC